MNGAELKAEFVRNGRTYTEVAEWLGISPTSLGNKVRGVREFKLSEVKTLIRKLNLSTEQYDRIFFDS